jgi:hypothetical protein
MLKKQVPKSGISFSSREVPDKRVMRNFDLELA